MSTYRTIPLTQGYVALVDAEDYDDLAQFKWRASVRPYAVYAHRSVRLADGREATEYMHRRLLPGVERVDHINNNGLDNRRANLRAATNAENMRNRAGLKANNTSGYRGVTWDKQARKWQVRIKGDGRHRSLGRFTDAEDAARAFDAAARKYFGEYAGYLNFPAERTTP